MNPTTQNETDYVINVDELLTRCLGNVDIAERILSKFQERFNVDLAQLEQALQDQDTEMIAEAAHRIKGASANVSACCIYELASEIEQQGRAQRISEIAPGVEQLRTEWTRFLDSVSTLELSN